MRPSIVETNNAGRNKSLDYKALFLFTDPMIIGLSTVPEVTEPVAISTPIMTGINISIVFTIVATNL